MTNLPLLVSKESIAFLIFNPPAYSPSEQETRMLLRKLYTAMILGNSQKYKCCIVFEDIESLKMVETTVWYVSETDVCLKGGVTIPISCIRDLRM